MGEKADLKQQVQEWASRVGKPKARELLRQEKISPSMAVKLVRGCYPSDVGQLAGAAILRAMAKSA